MSNGHIQSNNPEVLRKKNRDLRYEITRLLKDPDYYLSLSVRRGWLKYLERDVAKGKIKANDVRILFLERIMKPDKI